MTQGLGIDIGGTGIKGALVDLEKGEFLEERYRIPTPPSATPNDVIEIVRQIRDHFTWDGPIGIGLPAAVPGGVARTAAHIDKSWIGTDAETLMTDALETPVALLNDADAAGLAEMEFGAGKGRRGLVMMLTLGTGIGSALFVDGTLVPNTELGHLEVNGSEAEEQAASSIRKKENLSWDVWAARVDTVLKAYEALFWPEVFVIGGGVSKKHDKFLPLLSVRTPVVTAHLKNQAGIIGAALMAHRRWPSGE